ncbi:NDMA-dependent alcohol dehydrogenase [Pseudonocardia humida]|uniref:NDMA-dependent alcohol dehydrogenase n=1 Tax=Pseudonocardia humida TaxID=2800819 RepID=A0ABT0ZY36_9PSEU|nr:NDMA-dependent alcohol dehydrogenase [Pseudonocardia humida]MCO1655659.1 NDMA-dependent alcohol dehydrogenase [Pseudonocardia humida]
MAGEVRVSAGVLLDGGSEWELVELGLDEPRAHEVRISFRAAGLCHSDHHVTRRDFPTRLPIVGGHEGAGVVEAVGPHVARVRPGDRVLCSYIPACGVCRPCSTGHENVCVKGGNAMTGAAEDGTFRFHLGGTDLGGFCGLGTFAQQAVVSEWACLPLPDDVPFEVGALLGCGVPTGWGSAVRAAEVRAGDVVVVVGVGGVGINAVQGARFAGARHVIAVDPVEFKRSTALRFGATAAHPRLADVADAVAGITGGRMADHVILTPGALDEDMIATSLAVVGRGGRVVVTANGRSAEKALSFAARDVVSHQREVRGALFGNCNPLADIPLLIELYRDGALRLDELVSRRYRLDQLNEAYRDMVDGHNIRGVVLHDATEGGAAQRPPGVSER